MLLSAGFREELRLFIDAQGAITSVDYGTNDTNNTQVDSNTDGLGRMVIRTSARLGVAVSGDRDRLV